ncbi:GNAT family N-acetyltransferase [Ferrimonas senticii]|uniref:GNAT family N-acetyltransferase n=1 Tax=Ferrimonas senticii TaxID=394566 RepID=UPI0003FE19B2|nr:GNAT family N-acetyltransferase [Ferrimonas senticii]
MLQCHWLSAEQAPLATAFYRRCGSKEQARGDERIAVLRRSSASGVAVIAAVLRLTPCEGYWLLRALLVDPDHRQQGLASMLLDFAGAEFAEPIWCFPYPHLRHLYQTAGFRESADVPAPIAARHLAYSRKQPLLLMVANLG